MYTADILFEVAWGMKLYQLSKNTKILNFSEIQKKYQDRENIN